MSDGKRWKCPKCGYCKRDLYGIRLKYRPKLDKIEMHCPDCKHVWLETSLDGRKEEPEGPPLLELSYADMTIRLQEEQLKTAARLMQTVRDEMRHTKWHHSKAWQDVEWFILNFDKK